MVWYRSHEAYQQKFARAEQVPKLGSPAAKSLAAAVVPSAAAPVYAVECYLDHQGSKFVDRFDANSYVALTRLVDSHDVTRGRGTVVDVLGCVMPPDCRLPTSALALAHAHVHVHVHVLPAASLRTRRPTARTAAAR